MSEQTYTHIDNSDFLIVFMIGTLYANTTKSVMHTRLPELRPASAQATVQ